VSLLLKSAIPVWVLVALAAVLIGLLSPRDQYLIWLPIALAASVVLSFCIQLALQRKEGLVDRTMASTGGSLLLLVAATGILWAVGPGALA